VAAVASVDLVECELCEKTVVNIEAHRAVCGSESPFDGRCPMCGEAYDEYLTHLSNCDAS
jgi:hypothetical protein